MAKLTPIQDIFPIKEHLEDLQARPEKYALLRKLPERSQLPMQFSHPSSEDVSVVILDVESTGLNPKKDEIIELAAVKATFTPDGELASLGDYFHSYNEPKALISDFITELTGITFDMVKDHHINQDALTDFLGDPQRTMIVCHNAAFDAKMVYGNFPDLPKYKFACSLKDIDWKSHGYSGRGLKSILLEQGCFYSAHNALDDTIATSYALRGHIKELLGKATITTHLVRAFGAPFDKKDFLKGRGYRWFNGDASMPKHWFHPNVDGLTTEMMTLAEQFDTSQVKSEKLTAYNRYL